MKHLGSLLLALVMLAGVFSISMAEEETGLPQAGYETNGFTVKSMSRFDMIGADVVVYEHNKTRAQVMFILNDDLNRTFEITFRVNQNNP